MVLSSLNHLGIFTKNYGKDDGELVGYAIEK
jgi:hypothetical protein